MRRVLFSDLDGTLLDHVTYDFRPALAAIRRLQQLEVPIVLASSKTAAEMIPLREQIGIEDPFVAENGGGLYLPASAGLDDADARPAPAGFSVVPLGAPIAELAGFLRRFCRRHQLSVRSFLDYSPAELASEAGLSEEDAGRALEREFDLPFPPPIHHLDALEEAAAREGLRVSRGGRYCHLTGRAHKGTAVERTARLYARKWGGRPELIGLGDSLNDLEMLRAVDRPVIVPNPRSSASLRESLPGAGVAPEPGPSGWNRAVLELLED